MAESKASGTQFVDPLGPALTDLQIRIENQRISIEPLNEAIENKEKHCEALSKEIEILKMQIEYLETGPSHIRGPGDNR
jgi:uncharacterized coiled-coil protein SlyX